MASARQPEPTAFFESSGHSSATRALILVSYHFPPSPVAGALRWERLSHHAAERGWGVDAIAVDPTSLADRDESRLDALPPGVRVFGVKPPRLAFERIEHAVWLRVRPWLARWRESAPGAGEASLVPGPASLARSELGGWPRSLRAWIRTHDAALHYVRDGRWAREAAALALRIHEPDRHAAVVSCGPPQMAHEGARRFAVASGLPLVVDLRDPWSLIERLPVEMASPLWLRLAARYERRVVERAGLVVLNTSLACEAMRSAYPQHRQRMIAVPNGWDDDPLPPPRRDGRFLVAYLGTIYLDRDPRPFFRAAGRVVRELALAPEQLAIEFMGEAEQVGGVPTAALAAAEGLERHFRVHPPRPRREALEFLAGASLLLSLPQDSRMAIPSKIFDYMRFEAWVLSLSEQGSATERVLRETDADVVAPDDVDGIARVLRTRFLEHREGVRPAPLARDDRFSRRTQAERLFDALERLIA